MDTLAGHIVSVHVGAQDTLSKEACEFIDLELDGILGDRHRGISRENREGDKQAEGVLRRNERMWSAVSTEELEIIGEGMELSQPLLASSLGANLCIEGIPSLSRLPRGTLLKFSSGVELMVEEYNPPCSDMGEKLAETYSASSGKALSSGAFSQAAKFYRGIVGVVEVPGRITVGDAVSVHMERLPKWLRG